MDSEIRRAIDGPSGVAKPLLVFALGAPRYHLLQDAAVGAVMQRLRTDTDQVSDYAAVAFDLLALLEDKMAAMTDDEFEGLLRPAFKKDEWKLIAMGAVLGFLVGELQLHLLLS